MCLYYIVLWDVFGENKNYNVLNGHKNAVLEVKWLTENHVISCSADKTVSLWDANKGTRVRKYTDHTAIVNTCSIGSNNTNVFVSGSDDGYVVMWDSRSKQCIGQIEAEFPVLTTCLSSDASSVYYAGVDNNI